MDLPAPSQQAERHRGEQRVAHEGLEDAVHGGDPRPVAAEAGDVVQDLDLHRRLLLQRQLV